MAYINVNAHFMTLHLYLCIAIRFAVSHPASKGVALDLLETCPGPSGIKKASLKFSSIYAMHNLVRSIFKSGVVQPSRFHTNVAWKKEYKTLNHNQIGTHWAPVWYWYGIVFGMVWYPSSGEQRTTKAWNQWLCQGSCALSTRAAMTRCYTLYNVNT